MAVIRFCTPPAPSAHTEAPWLRQNNATGKIPLKLSGKSALPARPVLSRQEGRIAIVTNAGGDAVDAAASARRFVRRAVFRERAMARKTNDAKAYGKTVWSRHPLLVPSCRWRTRSDR